MAEVKPPPTLATFLISHCRHLNQDSPETIAEINPLPNECPICMESSTTSPAILINSPPCTHIFCSSCLSRHILAGYNTCPLCRAQWYHIPPGATTARTVEIDMGIANNQLHEFVNESSTLVEDEGQGLFSRIGRAYEQSLTEGIIAPRRERGGRIFDNLDLVSPGLNTGFEEGEDVESLGDEASDDEDLCYSLRTGRN
ncbi:hypothetical protein CC80DRAFT_554860 [Byssothecium circinans]|uniref:RING-type domain-containing protein n=1 Tax=Byssothecium circinans TaxID=147558 RepID=A0A6A5TCF7_9PLEO|nr:hypothetical protein CC80DRAFT_554860 [Byssothecium circinans]